MNPKRAVENDPDRTLPHLVVRSVSPAVDGGRYSVKRQVGDELRIGADIFTDGHDVLAARAVYHAPGERRPGSVPLTYSFDDDRWFGTLRLDRVGEWRFTVEGWIDRFATWRGELEKKVGAGQDVASELLEGADQVREAEPHARGDDHGRLAHYASVLGDPAADRERRVTAALSDELRGLMASYGQPYGLTPADGEYRVRADRREAAFAAWYEFFPRSTTKDPKGHGTFRDAERALPRIAKLGFDVIYLPPIHPIGHTHRKGPNNALVAAKGDPGSPWAIGNEHGGHTAVNPQLGTLADFRHFVEAARSLGLEVALDYALQCSPDHPWVREHPEWFFIRPDGTIKYAENPPKKYEDIYPINFWCDSRQELWDACRDIFLFWIEQGVRTFRVDNPHTKPFAFWEWALAEVQREHPDTIFLSEAFTRPKRMQTLAKLGFSQSYTYFTWRNHAAELAEYLRELSAPEMADFFRGNFFANTPDILHEYLQHGGRPAFRVRLLLAGTLSPLYGIYSGFELSENVPVRQGSEEYLDSEKYQVRVRDWAAPGNLDDDITRLNRIRRSEPALQTLTNLSFHESGHPDVLTYLKGAWGRDLLCAVSLNAQEPVETDLLVPRERLGLQSGGYTLEDLLTGERIQGQGDHVRVRFDPAVRAGYVWRVGRGEGVR